MPHTCETRECGRDALEHQPGTRAPVSCLQITCDFTSFAVGIREGLEGRSPQRRGTQGATNDCIKLRSGKQPTLSNGQEQHARCEAMCVCDVCLVYYIQSSECVHTQRTLRDDILLTSDDLYGANSMQFVFGRGFCGALECGCNTILLAWYRVYVKCVRLCGKWKKLDKYKS